MLEATALATCNRVEVYAEVDRFHGSVETVSRLLCERAGHARRGDRPAPVRPLRRRRGLPPLQRRRRPRLHGGGRGADPRPGARRAPARPGDRHDRARPERAVPAGAAGRQAGPRRDRHRPGRALARARPPSTAPPSTSGRFRASGSVVVGAGAMASLAVSTVSRLGAVDVVIANRTDAHAARLARAVRRPGGRAVRHRPGDRRRRHPHLLHGRGRRGAPAQPGRGRAQPRHRAARRARPRASPRRGPGGRRAPGHLADRPRPVWPRSSTKGRRPGRGRRQGDRRRGDQAPSSPPADRPASPPPWWPCAPWRPVSSRPRWTGC